MACRYDQRMAPPHITAYIDSMSQLPWCELGHSLQLDIARSLGALFRIFKSR
jgi:hypothetical protein